MHKANEQEMEDSLILGIIRTTKKFKLKYFKIDCILFSLILNNIERDGFVNNSADQGLNLHRITVFYSLEMFLPMRLQSNISYISLQSFCKIIFTSREVADLAGRVLTCCNLLHGRLEQMGLDYWQNVW